MAAAFLAQPDWQTVLPEPRCRAPVMGGHANSRWLNRLGWLAVLVTGSAALAMPASLVLMPEATASP